MLTMKTILTCLAVQFVFAIPLIAQVDCDNTSTGNIPINDLGTGFYFGAQGGLYPGGSNVMPTGHAKAGKTIGNSIKPLNADGAVDFENGVVVFAGFGASTAGNTFNTFKSTVNGTPDLYNPCLKFVNLCMGGKGLETMIPPFHDWYWEYLTDSLIPDAGLTRAQVQIAWIKTASKDDSIPEFPLQADAIYEKYIPSIQRLKENFPNLKILYIGSHAYGGYAGEDSDNADLAGEPAAYYGGFSVKWVIEDQIMGNPELAFKGAGLQAPWLSWGPYYWADGVNPRATDGLSWVCSDYEPDGGGFHLAESGKEKEASMLIDFLYYNSSSKNWFRNGPAWAACDPAMRNADGSAIFNEESSNYFEDELTVYPSPNTGNFYISYYNTSEEPRFIKVVNNQGQIVFEETILKGIGDVSVHVQIDDLPAGIYHIKADGNGMQLARSIVVN